jgi:hypothetical protein
MAEIDYPQLQQQYGGRYIARRDSEVLASADTYDALSDALERFAGTDEPLIIEYVEPIGTLRVY